MADDKSLRTKVAKGAIWTLLEKVSMQLVTFVVSMVLARLLTPEDYGTVALMGIFFVIVGAFVDCGLGGALIQKKNADDLDFNSVFYLNLALSLIGYFVLYFLAPYIAEFYNVPKLSTIIRVSAFSFIFNAVNAIQNAELIKKMLFNLSFKVSLIGSIASSVCGVTLALLGYGVWALVWSSLIACLVGMFARWFIIAWRPKLLFSLSRLKPLFSYGWKMAAAGLLDSVFANLNSMLIGKFYCKADVAFVNKGRSLPELAMNEIDGTLGRVSFPALVLMRNDKVRLRESMRKMMECSVFIVFPLLVALWLCSRSLIRIFFGPQWLPAAPYMGLVCFSASLLPLQTVNSRGIQALGRSDVHLKLELIKKGLAIVIIASTFWLGVFPWMAISAFVLSPINVVITSWPNKRLLGYTIIMQVKDILPIVRICVLEAISIVGIGCILDCIAMSLDIGEIGPIYITYLIVKVMLQFSFGIGVYIVLSNLLRIRPMYEYARVVVNICGNRFRKLADFIANRFLQNCVC